MRAGWGVYCLARVYDSATAVGAQTFTADITTTVTACNVQVAAILDWYFSPTSRAIKQLLASQPTPTFSFVFSHSSPPKFQNRGTGRYLRNFTLIQLSHIIGWVIIDK